MSSTSPPSFDRPFLTRASTAPEKLIPAPEYTERVEQKSSNQEIQWLQDGSCSRPPTPHNGGRRGRMFRGPSPMRLQSEPAPANHPNQVKQAATVTFANHPPNNFPILPNLVRASSSKFSKKFSRRSATLENARALSTSGTNLVEFDKLESLAGVSSTNPTSSHRQYGSSEISKSIDQSGSSQKRVYRRSFSAAGRQSNLKNLDAGQRPGTNPAQNKSTLFDFFRRGPASSTPNSRSQSKDFDDMTVYKPVVVASDPSRKKSDAHTVRTMQPRSPRYDSGRSSLPEIERLIRLSQRRKEGSTGPNGGSTGGKSEASGTSLNGKAKR